MSARPIHILSAPIQSGKTTALLRWSEGRPRLGGILCPDVGGLRHLFTLHDRVLHPFQMDDETFAAGREEALSIGRFHFRAATFALARQVLLADAGRPADWLVIDEIGKLELKNQGFEPAAGEVVRRFLASEMAGNLLLVVRPDLLRAVLDFYEIKNYHLLPSPAEVAGLAGNYFKKKIK